MEIRSPLIGLRKVVLSAITCGGFVLAPFSFALADAGGGAISGLFFANSGLFFANMTPPGVKAGSVGSAGSVGQGGAPPPGKGICEKAVASASLAMHCRLGC